jgi:hypothetical protein
MALGRAALMEPQFAKKISEDRADEIIVTVENNLENLAIPEKIIQMFRMEGSPLPPLPGVNPRPLVEV